MSTIRSDISPGAVMSAITGARPGTGPSAITGAAAGRVSLAFGVVCLLLATWSLPAFGDVRIAQPGRWRKHRAAPSVEMTEEQLEAMEKLNAVGYLTGTREPGKESGVTVHVSDAVCPGLNFYTSGHGPEAILMEASGEILHRWRYEYTQLPDSLRRTVGERNRATEYWRRAHLFENGDLLAIFEGEGLLKIDRDSELIWYFPNRAHHDLDVRPSGDIVVLTREPGIVPWINPTMPVLEDFISVLGPDGSEKRRVSLPGAFRDSGFEHIWEEADRTSGDIFHTNTVEVLAGRLADRSAAFRRGNVLTSILYLDAIAVVDLEMEKIVWARRGTFRRQHDPTVLDNGNLLLFDNGGDRGYSEILELDPFTGEVLWSYRGTEAAPFQTDFCGACQRLANGNTLVTESDNGRAFEVTAAGEIVWEFICPYRARGMRDYIATVFEMIRLPEGFPTSWAAAE